MFLALKQILLSTAQVHKHLDKFDSNEILCSILSCIYDYFFIVLFTCSEVNGSHQHTPWSIFKLEDFIERFVCLNCIFF